MPLHGPWASTVGGRTATPSAEAAWELAGRGTQAPRRAQAPAFPRGATPRTRACKRSGVGMAAREDRVMTVML